MGGEDGVKPDESAWMAVVSTYGTGIVRGQRIVRGRLGPGLRPDDAGVRAALDAWPGRTFLHEDPEGAEVVLVGDPAEPDRTRWVVHVLLFLATLFTTHMAGAMLAGVDPLSTDVFRWNGVWIPYPTGVDWGLMSEGTTFSLAFLGILMAHEMGHYLTARRHRVRVTPPFFIPFPAYWSIVGTLGAFIRIKGPTVRRSILFDIGAGGPLASFAVSIPLIWLGLARSTPATGFADPLTPYIVPFAGQAVWIGNGLLFHAMAWLQLPGTVGHVPLVLHPLAFAGWLGLFVTMLNLLPVGQLDGGHILYALSGRLQRRASRLFLLALLPLGFLWAGWWVWAAAVLLINRARLAHPPVLQPEAPVGRSRRMLGWVCVLIFLLTLVPVPIAL